MYKKLQHREHVLHRPGMYIGSIVPELCDTWIYDSNCMQRRTINYIPGLLKIIDEILVNAIDHCIRTRVLNLDDSNYRPVRRIDVCIDTDIEICNDGSSIEIRKDSDGVWIPELIFGHLLTSANYDNELEIGGQNGIGAKACNIFSEYFMLDIIDDSSCQRYTQHFERNMSVIHPPEITKCRLKSKTVIRFKPDFSQFSIHELDSDMLSLIRRRIFDVAAMTPSDVSVWFQGEKIPIKTFPKYVSLYTSNYVHESISNWDIAVSLTDESTFQHVSFVNGVSTLRGGRHVDYISNYITRKIVDFMNKKHKVHVKSQHVKNILFVFVRATITSPFFDSQSKETLTTPSSKWSSKIVPTECFIDKLLKLDGLVDKLSNTSVQHAEKDAKKTDGIKKSRINIPKLEDAEWAGTSRSSQCTLLLTEGDSAKASAISGIGSRQKYGIFPLRGKLMNVRDLSLDKINSNVEICAIKKIIGLQSGVEYTSTDKLRYGKVMIMTDADLDGSHIKGLVINLFMTLWPSLVEIGMLSCLNTPIVKTFDMKGKSIAQFYTMNEFTEWCNIQQNPFKTKYYKGLGTSTASESKQWFDPKTISKSNYIVTKQCGDSFIMAFLKSKSHERKHWLENYDESKFISIQKDLDLSLCDFINSELIHFSNYDIIRSIPSVIDGLKISQRKVLFGCRKKNMTQEVRVAQLAAYVSEVSCFHHGEASMQGTIIGMAQNFIGSGNNCPLLESIGQFGTRLVGGNDAASPRYIHSKLSSTTPIIFRNDDDAVLQYLYDDGVEIEPVYYVPIIPMILVNGAQGIGTGYSTNIPSHSLLCVIEMVRQWLDNFDERINSNSDINFPSDPCPSHNNFEGTIEWYNGKYRSRGIVERDPKNKKKIKIRELPIGIWTDEFKERLLDKDYNFVNASTDVKIDFTITSDDVDELMTEKSDGLLEIENQLKLWTTRNLNITNMHLINHAGKIQKYQSIWEIVDEFCKIRYDTYQKRKVYCIQQLQDEIRILSNKVLFIDLVVTKQLDLYQNDETLEDQMIQLGLQTESGSFSYLLYMQMNSLTKSKKQSFDDILERKKKKIYDIETTDITTLWLNELSMIKL